jgi:hypothetical protein
LGVGNIRWRRLSGLRLHHCAFIRQLRFGLVLQENSGHCTSNYEGADNPKLELSQPGDFGGS